MTLQTSQEVRTLEQLRSERFQNMLRLSEFLGEGAEVGDLNEALAHLEQRLENADLIDRLKTLQAELPVAVERLVRKAANWRTRFSMRFTWGMLSSKPCKAPAARPLFKSTLPPAKPVSRQAAE